METVYPLALSIRRKFLLQPPMEAELIRNPCIFVAGRELCDELRIFETTRARLITDWLRPLKDDADPAEVAAALARLRKACDDLLWGFVAPATRRYYDVSVHCDVVWSDERDRRRPRPVARPRR